MGLIGGEVTGLKGMEGNGFQKWSGVAALWGRLPPMSPVGDLGLGLGGLMGGVRCPRTSSPLQAELRRRLIQSVHNNLMAQSHQFLLTPNNLRVLNEACNLGLQSPAQPMRLWHDALALCGGFSRQISWLLWVLRWLRVDNLRAQLETVVYTEACDVASALTVALEAVPQLPWMRALTVGATGVVGMRVGDLLLKEVEHELAEVAGPFCPLIGYGHFCPTGPHPLAPRPSLHPFPHISPQPLPSLYPPSPSISSLLKFVSPPDHQVQGRCSSRRGRLARTAKYPPSSVQRPATCHRLTSRWSLDSVFRQTGAICPGGVAQEGRGGIIAVATSG